MTLTVAEVHRWDARAVRKVAEVATRRADAVAVASERLAAMPAFTGWDGVAADTARDAIDRTRRDLETHAQAARAVAQVAARAADEIVSIKAELRLLARAADDGKEKNTRFIELLSAATALDVELACAIGRAGSHAPLSPVPPAGPAGDSPDTVSAWWASLTQVQRAALLARDPERFGNLAGIPAAERDLANRRVLAADLRRDPTRSADDATRRTNAMRVAAGLDDNAGRTGADVLLLCYQPAHFAGQGRAAIAIGDPDAAQHTSVLVPGTGNSVSSGWLSNADASAVFIETAAASGGDRVCVVAWMGYDAPDSMLDPRVALPALAHHGGALLAADVNALQATSRTGSHVTVIGHSYGSTTVADAAAGYGMRAGDVVLVGSPGTDMARSAGDFNLPPGGHVYVGSASTDPVTAVSGLPGPLPNGDAALGAGLGADPAADGFGSTRFKAEVPGITWRIWDDHSHYFDSGSESLYSIADISAGDGAALQEHGMTAEHRRGLLGRLGTELGLPTWSNPLVDPELTRAAGSGYYHEPDHEPDHEQDHEPGSR